MVTLTSIFDGYDRLIQPTETVRARASAVELGCFFAFVDRRSYELLLAEARADGTGVAPSASAAPRVGVWTLLLLEGSMPFDSSRRNSRVPKMLAHRLFPRARYALWVDAKLRLHTPPSELRRRFLPAGVALAAYRNLRRDHIDEERDWMWKHKCSQDVDKCSELFRQWAAYEAEQAEPGWTRETVAIEGSVLLQDLQSPVHNALFCAWFNEYVRYGERDQISIAYVLHRMGLTAAGTNVTAAVRLIERKCARSLPTPPPAHTFLSSTALRAGTTTSRSRVSVPSPSSPRSATAVARGGCRCTRGDGGRAGRTLARVCSLALCSCHLSCDLYACLYACRCVCGVSPESGARWHDQTGPHICARGRGVVIVKLLCCV
jgi:hypothetical protein